MVYVLANLEHKGHRSYVKKAVDKNISFDEFRGRKNVKNVSFREFLCTLTKVKRRRHRHWILFEALIRVIAKYSRNRLMRSLWARPKVITLTE